MQERSPLLNDAVVGPNSTSIELGAWTVLPRETGSFRLASTFRF